MWVRSGLTTLAMLLGLLLAQPALAFKCGAIKAAFEQSAHTVRDWFATASTIRGKSRSASDAFLAQETALLDHFLKTGSLKSIKDRYDPLFTATEGAAKTIVICESLLKEAELNSRERAELIDIQQDAQKRFGRNYPHYRELRAHLERIAKDTQCQIGNCRKKAIDYLAEAGLQNSDNLRSYIDGLNHKGVKNGFTRQRRPALSTLTTLFNRADLQPVRQAAKAWRTQVAGIYSIWRFLTSPPLRTAIYQSIKLAGLETSNLAKIGLGRAVLRELFNIRAKIEHFPELVEIERSSDNIAQKTERIKALAASDPELLLTFARKSDSRELWIEIRDFARTKEAHAELYQSMVELRREGGAARKLGDIAPDYRIRLAQPIVDYLAAYGAYRGFAGLWQWLTSTEDSDPDPNESATIVGEAF